VNFLGHLVLSGDDPLVITGNFMADAVKGRDLSMYAGGLEQGIRMHRRIDSFTDTHPITLIGRERLRAHCGKYAGVALDLFYDHCIASTWNEHSTIELETFAQNMYAVLNAHAQLMPERTRRMLLFMVQHDWLVSYQHEEGLARALHGLSRRVPGGEVLSGAEVVLRANRDAYVAECSSFLRALRKHLSSEKG
jgi:acyl carrier protein phosphodiesterase